MYAVIETGGKQYRVTEGSKLKVEKLLVEPENTFEFENILLLSDENDVIIGQPYIEGAKVSAKVIEQGRDKKIKILKFKRRKHHMKRMGHRQSYTALEITNIQGPKAKTKTTETTETTEAKTAKDKTTTAKTTETKATTKTKTATEAKQKTAEPKPKTTKAKTTTKTETSKSTKNEE